MSCFSPCYNPIPTRDWSRFQNTCSFNNTSVITPILALQISNNYKGNILQYKKNSSNLTKKQIYTQIAKGNWTNRNTTWATQTETYTNPNTNGLTRVNNTLICYGRDVSCNPTSNSDVPGPIINLCYDDTQQTYYPKTRLTYLAGSNKWPTNYKNMVPATYKCG
jgi:hypothetical protein